MKSIIIIISIVLISIGVSARQDSCSDSLFLLLREKPFDSLTTKDRKCYQDIRDAGDDKRVCSDMNIGKLVTKPISEMTENEYAIFQDVIKDCESFNPCSLSQFNQVMSKPLKSLTNNEIDFMEYCLDICSHSENEYTVAKHKKAHKRKWLLVIAVAFLSLIGGVLLAFPMESHYK